MRRRAIGITLAGLGAFLIVVAVLLRTYVGGQVIKFPLNEYDKVTLQGTGVSYFSPTLVKPVSGATIQVTSTVKGDASAGTSSTAVWNEFSYLYDTTNHATFEFSTRRFAFDRRTAELVNCCGASVNGNTAIRQSGLVGFLWPLGTQKKTYDVFDPVLNQARPARYEGTSTIDGIRVYRFFEHVSSTRAGSETLPGSLVGMPGQSMVTLPEYYTGNNTFWVDPLTGAELNEHQDEKLTLEDSTGTQRLLLLNGDLMMTPQSVQATVKVDQNGRTEFGWLEIIVPLLCLVLGLVALIIGIVLARTRREGEHARTTAPEPVLDPAQ
jgi:hypothetical protein